jgi:hypothetical protein
MLSLGGSILNFRKPLFIRLAIVFLFLIIFWRRITVGITSISTFVVFTFWPAPVLGDGDGWDLVNLVAPPNATEITPRIIHQVRLGNLTMKEKWKEANASCIALNKPEDGWRYELWDTERANAFVAAEYPDILDTFLGYPQGAQHFIVFVLDANPLIILPSRNPALRLYPLSHSLQVWRDVHGSRRQVQSQARLFHHRRLDLPAWSSHWPQQCFLSGQPRSSVPSSTC